MFSEVKSKFDIADIKRKVYRLSRFPADVGIHKDCTICEFDLIGDYAISVVFRNTEEKVISKRFPMTKLEDFYAFSRSVGVTIQFETFESFSNEIEKAKEILKLFVFDVYCVDWDMMVLSRRIKC